MKYERPRVRPLNSKSASGYCGTGTGAASDGCTAGPAVATYCAAGTTAAPSSCTDGLNASGCAIGTVATTVWPTRCVTGNAPA